jgi:cbb3-type cytochrome oxidase subunit 3
MMGLGDSLFLVIFAILLLCVAVVEVVTRE